MLPPNIALMQDQLRELSAQLSRATKSLSDEWFQSRGIQVYSKDLFWLLNHNQHENKNHWNILCNGLVYTREGFTASVPPVKFNSINSREVNVNLHTSDLVQKVGGEMITAFFPWGNTDHPCLNTKTQCSYATGDMADMKEAKKVIRELKYRKSDSDYCFTFHYDGRDLFLVAGRHVESLLEHEETELDEIGKRLGCMRPMRFPLTKGWVSATELMNQYDEDFIIRDRKTGERAHVMMPITIKRPKLLETGLYKHLLPYWLAGQTKALVRVYPEFKEKMARVDEALLKVKRQVKIAGENWSTIGNNRPGLVEALRESHEPFWSHRLILRMLGMHPERWDNCIDDYFKKLTPKGIIDILGLVD